MRVLEAKTGFLAEEDNLGCRERERGEREGLEVNFSGEENEREESRETAVIFFAHAGAQRQRWVRSFARARLIQTPSTSFEIFPRPSKLEKNRLGIFYILLP